MLLLLDYTLPNSLILFCIVQGTFVVTLFQLLHGFSLLPFRPVITVKRRTGTCSQCAAFRM